MCEGTSTTTRQFVAPQLIAAALATILVAAGARAETVISGVDDAVRSNVLAYIDVDELGCDVAETFVEPALARAASQTIEALNAFGYYEPRITTRLTQREECWRAEIAIDPGEPVVLREVDIRLEGPAATQPDFLVLRNEAAPVAGNPLNHGRYDQFKRRLLDLSRNRGFVEAGFATSRLDIYPEQHTADIALHYESGPRYSVGEVDIGEAGLEPDFVAAFHGIRPGLPFDNRLLTTAFRNLNDSGYFDAVDVQTLPANADTRTIPVRIELTPSPRRLIGYGVGYATDTGPRFRFERLIRRFNERGHQLSLDARLSPVVSEFTSFYRMPIGDPRYDWLHFNVGAKREETDTASARSIEAGVRRVIDRPRGWDRTQFLSYVVEDFEVGTQAGRPHLLIPGVDWTRLRGNDALRPDNGSRVSFELRAADESLLSDAGFVQVVAGVKWIRRVSGRGRVLLRGRAGYTVDDEFAHLPPSIRFFAGGDSSIRGFDFKSLGPVDANGDVIGGPRLIEVSAEYEHEIKPRWSVAVFADGGNAFDELDFDMRTGAGIGARWRSPLGPIRIDVAWPVDDPGHGARLHLVLGPDL